VATAFIDRAPSQFRVVISPMVIRGVQRGKYCGQIFIESSGCRNRPGPDMNGRQALSTKAGNIGGHYMQVSKWLGHYTFVVTLSIYAD
jgi:hypothetical protein